MMTNLMKMVALSASVGVMALGSLAYAEDDEFDSLLSELETETAAEEPKEADGESASDEESPAEAKEATEEAAEEAEEVTPAEDPEEAAEEAGEEEPAEEAAEATEETADAEEAADEAMKIVSDLQAEVNAPEEKVADTPEEREALLDEIRTYEEIRRKAFDEQALREIGEARTAMARQDYAESARHYGLAKKLLNDSPATKDYRTECLQGMAEALYRAALQEDKLGRRDRAVKYMEKAVNMRHPKARKQLESWLAADDPDANKTDITDVMHAKNDPKYKELRKRNIEHLKRAGQYMAIRNLDKALDECELVLVTEPYNQEAIRMRHKIERKRATILAQEKKATREGMIADVDAAWRPPYAVDAREREDTKAGTVKASPGEDPERKVEQDIVKRMKEMKLPTISFKPPATIIDAIDYFRGASKDYDRPDIPLEQRGFNFVLKTPETLRSQAASSADESNDFSESGDEEEAAAQSGVPIIPMITASDITFYDALKLVCESVEYKFKVQGSIVMVMPKDMSIDEMVTRSYPVVAAFLERMGSASSDMKEMKAQGFGGGVSSRRGAANDDEESQERDWKEFFSLMGVQWPDGSSILYIKTIGKLRVKNTYENLAELEKALTELNVDQKLVEIEARFVEVCQEDLNSLGFEWILNSDYSLNLGRHISRALNLKGGAWGERSGNYTKGNTWADDNTTIGGRLVGSNGSSINQPDAGSNIRTTQTISEGGSQSYSENYWGNGGRWIRSARGSKKGLGLNGFGGTSEQQNGMRFLSTESNPIAGEAKSINDNFMKLNAFIGNADLSMILHMLSQRSDTDLLSAPKVLTRPGEEAVIKVVTEYIYPTDYDVQLQSSSSGSGNNSGSSQSAILAVVEPQSFTMREVGVILDVTPTLTDDGNLIDLKLNTQVVDEPTWKNYGMKIPFTGNSSLQNFQGLGEIFTGLASIFSVLGEAIPDTLKAVLAENATTSAGAALENLTASGDNMTYYDAPMEQPFFHVRSIDSSVSIYPGATIVMGGLITETRKSMDDKIPFLGDLPIIGRFFRSHCEQTSKRNLLIFITSRLVDVRGREVAIGGGQENKDENVTAAPEPEAE